MKKILFIIGVLISVTFLLSCQEIVSSEKKIFRIDFYVDDEIYNSQRIKEGNKLNKPKDPEKEG